MGFIMKPERPKSPFLWEVTPKEISAYVESLEVLVSCKRSGGLYASAAIQATSVGWPLR